MTSHYFHTVNKICEVPCDLTSTRFSALSPIHPHHHPQSQAIMYLFSTNVLTFLTFPHYSSWLEDFSFLPSLLLNLAETYSPLWAQLLLGNPP